MLKSIDEPCAASATLPAAAAVARRCAAATSRAHRISTFQIGMASGLPCQCALMPLAEQSSQLTFIGGDGARNDQNYDRKALTQVWQFSSYSAESPDYGHGLESNNSRGSCSSSQCDDDEDEEACSTSGMATDVGSMSMTFSRRAKQDDDFGDDEYSPSKTDTSSCSTYWHITAIGDDVI